MCGISALLTNKLNHKNEFINYIEKMNHCLKHRGPDFQNYWLDENNGVCLGHTRLSIQDLSANGNQPMLSQNERYVLCFNGEIYNHFDIRKKIEKNFNNEIHWRGTSDTETLLKSIEIFGFENTLNFLSGMFAICLFDRKKHKINIAIDRFGEKPLYFGNVDKAFIIGSELKVFKAFKEFNNQVDRNSLDEFVRYSCIRAPRTIYKNIFKLEPGSMFEISLDKILSQNIDINFLNKKQFYKYWWKPKDVIIKNRDKKIKDYEKAKIDVEDTLFNSVKSQLISDVPLGSFLSGGIDSSLITALMCKNSKNKINTFTIGFSEDSFDESKYAKQISKILRTDHHEAILSSRETLSIIPDLMNTYDEPFADSSQIPTILLSKFAKNNVKVALSGDGGDELFGGYNRYFWINRIWKYFSWLPFEIRIILGKILSSANPDKINYLYYFFSNNKNLDKFFGQKAIKTFERLKYVKNIEDLFISLTTEWNWNDKIVVDSNNKKISLYEDFEELRSFNFIERMMYWDTINYLPNDILCKVDRASMSKSLETRAPFLNEKVYEISSMLPLEMKIKKNNGKVILKDILKKYIPNHLIERPKQGFGIPLSSWLRTDLKDWAETLLSPNTIKNQGYFDNNIIQRYWGEHKNGRFDFHNKLWPILMFQSWMEHN